MPSMSHPIIHQSDTKNAKIEPMVKTWTLLIIHLSLSGARLFVRKEAVYIPQPKPKSILFKKKMKDGP